MPDNPPPLPTSPRCAPASCSLRPRLATTVEARGPCSTSRTRSRIGCQNSPTTAIGFPGHHRFVQHLPNYREFHQRARSALASHKSIRQSHQFKQPLLPSLHSSLPRPPTRSPCALKNSAVTPYVFPPASFAPRDTAFHHAAISPAANREARARQAMLPNFPCLRILRITFACGRELPNTVTILSSVMLSLPQIDQAHFLYLLTSLLRYFVLLVELLHHRQAQSVHRLVHILIFPPSLLLKNEKISFLPPGVSA